MCRLQGRNTIFRLPNLVDSAFDSVNQFRFHLLLVVQKPRTLRGLRHIRKHHLRVVERVMPEIRTNAAIGRERFVFEFVVVNELYLVNEHPRDRLRVRRPRDALEKTALPAVSRQGGKINQNNNIKV